MPAPHLTLELARRIELAEAHAAAEGADVLRELRPASAATVLQIAGGLAVYCGANSPITQAVGLGLNGPVTAEEFATLENFYRTRGESVRVETCPLADPTLIEHFGKNNYRVTEFTNVMALPPNDSAIHNSAEIPPGIAIAKITPAEIDLWTATVSQGFAEHFPVTPELLEVMKMFALGKNVECYLATADGAVAGGATLAIHEGVAGLFGASTLPEFRNRGIQTALLATRIARARERHCDLAVCLAQPGSTSQRNVVRLGFSVLYTRVKFERDWPPLP